MEEQSTRRKGRGRELGKPSQTEKGMRKKSKKAAQDESQAFRIINKGRKEKLSGGRRWEGSGSRKNSWAIQSVKKVGT